MQYLYLDRPFVYFFFFFFLGNPTAGLARASRGDALTVLLYIVVDRARPVCRTQESGETKRAAAYAMRKMPLLGSQPKESVNWT